MRHLLASIAALALTLFFANAAPAQTISKSQTGAVGTVITCTDTSGNTGKCVLPMTTPVTAAGVPMGSATSPTVVRSCPPADVVRAFNNSVGAGGSNLFVAQPGYFLTVSSLQITVQPGGVATLVTISDNGATNWARYEVPPASAPIVVIFDPPLKTAAAGNSINITSSAAGPITWSAQGCRSLS